MRRFRSLTALVVLTALLAAGGAATYRVKRGDTLGGIARRNGTTVAELARINGLDNPNFIREGQLLDLSGAGRPTANPRTTPISSSRPSGRLSGKHVVVGGSGQRTHTVRAGESLARIARRYGTTSAELARANGIRNPNLIRIGQTLTIPGGGGEPWLCPVKGRIWFSDSWGQPRPGGRAHKGTDLFAYRGTPVVAPVAGRVVHASGRIAGNAFYLHADDGNVYYGAHLDKLQVGSGSRVGRGARIGTVGSTGNAEGLTPHLHFEIHIGGDEAVNPVHSISKWCG